MLASWFRAGPVALLLAALLLLAGLTAPAHAQIFPDQTGSQLINSLQSSYTPSQTLGYDVARDEMYRYLDTRDGVLIGRYGGYSVDIPTGQDPSSTAYQNGSGISAEHVFPQSQGAGNEPAKSDMHNLFPVKQTINSARSNSPFDEITDTDSDTWYIEATSQSSTPSTNISGYSERDGSDGSLGPRFEPRESHKGNTARAMFYFITIYETEANQAFFDAQKDVLLQWHQDDPVDANEEDLTNWIQTKQGTANPFVLDPTLASRAFGTASRSPTVSLTASSQSVSEGDGSATLTAQISNPDGNAVAVDVAFDAGNSTATTADLGSYATQTITFGSGATSGDTQTVTVTLTDDTDTEITETATFTLQNLQTSGSAVLSSPQQTEVSITDNDGGSGASRLIISQYVDTDSGTEPKGIELWNVSGAAIDFSVDNLTVNRYANGGTSPTQEFSLTTGTLADGDVMVIGGGVLSTYMTNNAASVSFYNDSFSHNGNDALEVVLGGQTEDVLGTVGSDPGTAWTGSGVSTADQTLQLLGGITSGTTTGFTDPSTRFETVSTTPSTGGAELSGFGVAPGSACPAPSAQPTALSLSAQSSSQINGSFTASSADAYLVARSPSASLSAVPADGTTYAAGDGLGTGTVVQVGTSTSFSDTGLSENTTYTYFVFAASTTSCASGGPTYLTAGELTGSATTDSPPSVAGLPFTEPFDDATQYTITQGADATDGNDNYFTRTDGANINKSYSGSSGSFFAGQDIDDPQVIGSVPGQLTWTGIDISGATGLEFTGLFGEVLDGSGDIDDDDFLRVEYRVDGGAWTDLIAFQNDGSQFNTSFLEDTDFDGVGDGTSITSSAGTMVAFTKSIPDTGTNLDLRFTASVDSGDEDFAIDDFEVTGAASGPIVQFATTSQAASEGDGSTGLTLELISPDGNAIDVDVAFDGGSSTADGSDIGSFTSQTVTFDASASSGATKIVSVPLTDDTATEGDETARFVLQNLQTTGGAQIGSAGALDLTITDNEAASPIIITEIMPNPSDVGDSAGEYVEVYNPTSSAIDIGGWTLRDDGSNSETLSGSILVPAEGYAVLCKDTTPANNGGIPCDGGFGQAIANSGDEVILEDGSGSEVDRVAYTGTWPFGTGTAMVFTGSASEDNSQEANWTQAASRQPGFDIAAGTDTGSPGARNVQSGFPEAYAAQINGSGAGWRMLSVPVTDAVVGDLASQNAVQGVTGSFPEAPPNVYVSYDGPGTDEGSQYWTPATDVTTALDNGRGFIWYLYDQNDNNGSVALPFTLTHAGPAPLDDVTVSVPADEAWHLLGNPYPFAIPVNALDLTGYQVNVQVYDPAAPGYTSKSGTDLIAPQQGFFVQRKSIGSGTDNLTFESDARTTATTPLLNATLPPAKPLRSLVLQMEARSAGGAIVGRDEATVRPHAEGTLGWDRRDASKLLPLDAPYASLALEGPGIDGPDAMAIRSLPEVLDQDVEIPIRIEAAGLEDAETVTFRWPVLPDGWGAELIDREGETVRLRKTSAYSVAAASVLPADALRGTSGNVSARSETMRSQMGPLRPTVRAKAQSSDTAPRFVLRLTPEPLPVELTAFEATQQADGITLTWQTASEQNNAGFEVQRQSAESGAWEALRFVEGAGTTSAPQDYRFRDAQPPFADSLVYRLKQVDTDGTTAFSPEVVVRRGPGSDVRLAAPFPNPTRQQATVRYAVPEGSAQPVRLDVYNVLGQRIATLVDETQTPGREELSLDASRWASGVYFLRLQVGDVMRTERVTVVR